MEIYFYWLIDTIDTERGSLKIERVDLVLIIDDHNDYLLVERFKVGLSSFGRVYNHKYWLYIILQ